MSQEKYSSPSDVQRTLFLSIAGYEYPKEERKGSMKTDRPFNKDDWKLSPWWVRYVFEPDSGHLFCKISHRMTNDRCYGWDHDGESLPSSEIEAVFPSHWF